jgi:class 3 adenylate cyclase
VNCPSCDAANRPDARFCLSCGTPLARVCPNGHPVVAGAQFCDECGAALGDSASAAAAAETIAIQPPATERRLVSVLFADLVGFTTASEARDAEDTRELLTRYFDLARTTIERYGGTVEKFIGDAVMAVWGAPVAREDDAERAVRAALDLIGTVSQLDERLEARAGVLTGEAAVTLGADTQGMVAGDLVNTASRIQSAAEPGTVLVGDATRRATEAAIAYEDAGPRELKGKAEPVPLWRARQVTAGRGGAQKSVGLEAPFVGRAREFRLLKDLFHATAEEGRARLVSVVGVAGIGKSRLGWEFFKYIDGLAEDIWWHRGRCLAYGEGVAYWALAEMVRGRAGILEEEDSASASAKLRAAVEEHVADPEERAWIEPRLAHLLALEERSTWSRDDLFSAWRVFFERLAEQGPCVLVVEDLQWADSGLLDFIEHLLEWSRALPLYVLTLARPELADRRGDWGAGKRNFTSLYLEPLAEEAMDELLRGLAPGLPEELRARIRERADGVPLYAVETVRMLVDRGLLKRSGEEYTVAAPVDDLEVPETLHALVAARLDGLPHEERRLLDDAAVLGKTFTARALSEISGRDEADVEPLLASLVRREVLGVQADPRSPERGQYGFLQALAQRVAYETLSRGERKARHVAVAEHLERSRGAEADEVVEVVAAHYLDAYRADPQAADSEALRRRAHDHLRAAGDRAESLGARAEAERYFVQAGDLVDGGERAAVLARAGWAAWLDARGGPAAALLAEAVRLYEEGGDERAAAAVSARLAEIEWFRGQGDDARVRIERAFSVLSAHEADESSARVAAEAARLAVFAGDKEAASERVEYALDAAERLRLLEVLSQALNTKALVIAPRRPEEALALMRHSLAVALDHDLVDAAGRAYYNLAFLLSSRDRFDEARQATDDAIRFARRRGDRSSEVLLVNQLCGLLAATGGWDEALELRRSIEAEAHEVGYLMESPAELLFVHVRRGDAVEAQRLAAQAPDVDDSDLQAQSIAWLARAAAAVASADWGAALHAAGEAYRIQLVAQIVSSDATSTLVEAAVAVGDLDRAAAVLDELDALPPGERTQSIEGHGARLRALLERAQGRDERIDPLLVRAAALFREVGMPFWLAVTLLEHAEWLAAAGRAAESEPLVREAREIFERLRAAPWLERAERLEAPDAQSAADVLTR